MKHFVFTVASVFLLSGAVDAATVSYSGSTGVAGTLSSLSLQQFDSSLGTLTGISISWDSGFNGTFRVVSDTKTGTASAGNNFVAGSIFAISVPAGAAGPSLNATAGTAFSASVPPTYNQFFSGGAVDDQAFGALASFIGLGTVNYNFFGTASATATVSDGLLSGIVNHLYLVNADITYNYDVAGEPSPVPLPAGLPLLAACLGALAVLRRRRA